MKEGFFFRPEESDCLDQFTGYHDYAVQLNLGLVSLRGFAYGCCHGCHPVTRETSIQYIGDGDSSLSFSDSLRGTIPNFLIGVWELELNGWHPIAGVDDPLGRFLLNVRQGRPITAAPAVGRSATEAIFHLAFKVAVLMEQHPALNDALAELRCRHRALHAVNPWCWWRPKWNCEMLWGIASTLREELRTLDNDPAGAEQCKHWFTRAMLRWREEKHKIPSFDWLIPTDSETIAVAKQLLDTLAGYDEPLLTRELLVDGHY
jgi:hypothetical protein